MLLKDDLDVENSEAVSLLLAAVDACIPKTSRLFQKEKR